MIRSSPSTAANAARCSSRGPCRTDATTQVVINLRDNREVHDKEPFVPFGRVVEGMDVADALFDEYGEAAGGGIRAGKQDPVFQGGNELLAKELSEAGLHQDRPRHRRSPVDRSRAFLPNRRVGCYDGGMRNAS